METELALEDLLEVKQVFDDLNLPLFLMYGTALGIYRDDQFLKSDHDIDLGTWGQKNKEKIWSKLEPLGFYKRAGKKDLEGQTDFLSIHTNRQVSFDIFLFEEYNDEYKAFTTPTTCCATLPKQFAKMEKIKFYGQTFLIPSPTEDYLTYFYGDWKDRNNRKQAR